MIPAKTIFGVAALAAVPILLALAFSESGPRTGGEPKASTPQGIISAAEAREPAVSPGTGSFGATATTANGATSADPSKRTVRVVLDSPFGLPSNVVVTTEPAKPPVITEEPPAPVREAKPLLTADSTSEQDVKPKPKKPRRKPAELGALYYAPPQPLPPPFFALR